MAYIFLRSKLTNIIVILCTFFFLVDCTSKKLDTDPSPSVSSEIQAEEIFRMITASGYSYYQNNSSPRVSVAENNAHGSAVVIKFNAKAKSVLGADGKLPIGSAFPDSSLIVKEIYGGTNSSLTLYAVMFKLPKDKNAASGWVWTEVSPSGAVVYPLASGAGCVPCHSRSGNRDFVRTFGVF